MKNVGFYLAGSNLYDAPLDTPLYRMAYETLAKTVVKKGGTCFLVRNKETYQGGRLFMGGWEYSGDTFRYVDGPIELDVVYNKGSDLTTDEQLPMVNCSELDTICTNKMQTYLLFPELIPRTVMIYGPDDMERALQEITTELVVTKPLDGWGGYNVRVSDRITVRSTVLKYPFLMQEFIDSSGGIGGLTPSVHDFRMIVMNGWLSLACIRQPAAGTLTANLSTGGTMLPVPYKMIPQGAYDVFKKVDAVFQNYDKRIYSIDCALNAQGEWKVIELNAKPGLAAFSVCGNGSTRYFEQLADTLLN